MLRLTNLKDYLKIFASSLRSDRGFSLVEIVIAAGLSTAVIAAAGAALIDSKSLQNEQTEKFWIEERRLEMANAIATVEGWNQTVALNPGMNCFTSPNGCPAARMPQPLKISLSGALLDGANANAGMSSNGDICNTFSSANGDASCPYGITLTWQAVCEGVACRNPQPKAVFSFRKKLPNQKLHDMPAYTRIVYRDPKLDNLSQTCEGIGGVLVGVSCVVNSLTSTCDTVNGRYAVGFDAVGKVVCGSVPTAICANDQVLTGFDATGAPICGFACTP
ncbi:MAG: hypothetical protein EOP06_01375 [Proteobacteria bacterium]|nr:MAG: hypothetical protein EOP06_01375 [Pseudomonadota bacterium]